MFQLLTDLIMPGMNGQDLADRVRSERPGIAVLYMSGYTDRAIFQHSILKEGEVFLQKPFSTADLLARVAGLMG